MGMFLSSYAPAIEGIYVGGEVGNVGLSGTLGQTYTNAIGFGIDLGVKTNSYLDILFHLATSSHSGAGGLNIYSQTVTGNFHIFEFADIEFTLGLGPGFYFFKTPGITNSSFGINAGGDLNARVDDNIRIGLGGRWNGVFGQGTGNYITFMMNVGYWFDTGK